MTTALTYLALAAALVGVVCANPWALAWAGVDLAVLLIYSTVSKT